MNINIRSSRGNYKVIEFDFSKFLFSKTSNKFFYIIDLNIYKKNKYLKKIKNNLVIIRSNENTKYYKKWNKGFYKGSYRLFCKLLCELNFLCGSYAFYVTHMRFDLKYMRFM